MGTARLFVAVGPPARVREELIAWARSAMAGLDRSSPLRLLGYDALHVTVCFLGERPVAEVKSIGAALEECAMPVGELSIGAPLWLLVLAVFWPQLNTYYNCMSGANTVSAQQACHTQLNNSVGGEISVLNGR